MAAGDTQAGRNAAVKTAWDAFHGRDRTLPYAEARALWETMWDACDFSWDGLADAGWDLGKDASDSQKAKRWPAPADFPVERKVFLDEGNKWKQASLQDYWRWAPTGDANDAPAWANGRLATDEEMVAAGLLIEVDGKLWHALHLQTALARFPDTSKVANDQEPSDAAPPRAPPPALGQAILTRLSLAGGGRNANLNGARAGGIDACLREFSGDKETAGKRPLHVSARIAALGAWNVDGLVFGPGANFHSAAFGDRAQFDSTIFGDEARFDAALFGDEAHFDAAKFGTGANFAAATFGPAARFVSATFGDGAGFQSAIIGDKTSFDMATFGNGAHFHSVVLGRRVGFLSATFGDNVSFHEATLGDEVSFFSATFGDGASFYSASIGPRANYVTASFGARARFDSAKFGSAASFRSARFGDDASFYYAAFDKKCDFVSTAFGKGAGFESVSFGDAAGFGSSTFGDSARFFSALFGNNARFREAAFGNDAHFGGATFKDDADFGFARFGNSVRFNSATFGSAAKFNSAVIGSGARFHSATFGDFARLRSVTFGDGASFHSATFGARAGFDLAIFGAGTAFDLTTFGNEVSFANATFGDNASFRSTTFEKNCSVRSAKFQGRIQMRAAEIKGYADFSDVTWPAKAEDQHGAFEGCRFRDVADFKTTNFRAYALFDGAEFKGHVLLTKPRPGELRTDALCNSALKAAEAAVASDRAAVKTLSKANARLKEGETRKEDDFRAERGADARFGALAGGFRTLKLAMAGQQDVAREQRFYRYELKARAKQPSEPLPAKVAASAYGLASDYGASIGRPFVALTVMMLAFAAAYFGLGWWNDALGTDRVEAGWQAWEFSWSNVFRPFSALAPEGATSLASDGAQAEAKRLAATLLYERGGAVGAGVRAVATLQSLLGIVLAFLFALAVRRRFQIT